MRKRGEEGSHGLPRRMRRVLHGALHLIAHARPATRQARRRTLPAPDARSSMRALRQAGAARGVHAPASFRGDVRADGAGGVCAAGLDGAGDTERWTIIDRIDRMKAEQQEQGCLGAGNVRLHVSVSREVREPPLPAADRVSGHKTLEAIYTAETAHPIV